MPYLIQKAADGSPVKKWDLHNQPVTVGRSETLDIVIADPEVSTQHCTILPRAGGYAIQDLHSRNGTWVNGQRVTEAVLKSNDSIRVGQTKLVLVDGLTTVIGQLAKEPKGYGTQLREITGKPKP